MEISIINLIIYGYAAQLIVIAFAFIKEYDAGKIKPKDFRAYLIMLIPVYGFIYYIDRE